MRRGAGEGGGGGGGAGGGGGGGEEEGGQGGHVEGDHVDGGGVVPPGDLVPQGVEPQPGLAGVAAGLVHHAPLGAGQVHGLGGDREVAAVVDEQQRLGEVGAVERLLGQQVGVERAAAGEGELAGQQGGDRPVGGRRDDRGAAGECHLGHRGGLGGGPPCLLGGLGCLLGVAGARPPRVAPP